VFIYILIYVGAVLVSSPFFHDTMISS